MELSPVRLWAGSLQQPFILPPTHGHLSISPEIRGYCSTQLPSTTSFWISCPKTHHNQTSRNEHLAAHTTHGGMFRDQRLKLYFNLFFIHLTAVKYWSLLNFKRNGQFLFFIYKESKKNFFCVSLWPNPSLSSNKMHFCNS